MCSCESWQVEFAKKRSARTLRKKSELRVYCEPLLLTRYRGWVKLHSGNALRPFEFTPVRIESIEVLSGRYLVVCV